MFTRPAGAQKEGVRPEATAVGAQGEEKWGLSPCMENYRLHIDLSYVPRLKSCSF